MKLASEGSGHDSAPSQVAREGEVTGDDMFPFGIAPPTGQSLENGEKVTQPEVTVVKARILCGTEPDLLDWSGQSAD